MVPSKAKSEDRLSLRSLAPILCFCIHHLSRSNVAASAVIPNQSLSSPSQINTAKNSVIWLHWNYTLDPSGVPKFFTFDHQEWTVKDMHNISSVIATKTTLDGAVTVSTSLPSDLRGRVAAFANNDTLMISNLQYNDTLLNYVSAVYLLAVSFPNVLRKQLTPTVNLSVVGAPEYTSTPARSLEVSEGDELPVVLHFDGNPKPSAELQWLHSNTKVAMTVTKEYEFIYKATYPLNPISSSYCGRTFKAGVKNNIGKATDVTGTVTVLLNIVNPDLRAGKPNSTCVEVDWIKKESGACSVTYTVNFKTAAGETKLVYTGVNVGKVTKCGISANITNVDLKMSSTKRSKTFSASVSQSSLPQRTTVPPPTFAPTTKATTPTTHKSTKSSSNANSSATSTASKATVKTPAPANKPSKSGANTGAIVGGVIGGLVAVVLILLLVMFFIKRRKQGKGKYTNTGETGLPLADKK